MSNKGITPRSEDYSQWYLDIIDRADLVENSQVRGAMVFKPYGYAIWENIKKELDKRIKARGVENTYFPLFIPLSLGEFMAN
jgi:prolyl-tRNA synthetase